jgi:hypothetical protein
VPTEHKQELRRRLKTLDNDLDQYLAGEYGVQSEQKEAHAKWLKSHQPFHWVVEFYGIMQSGGFNIVIGNPPWREYAAVKKHYVVKNYSVLKSGNLYALCSERALQLMGAAGYFSFITQLPLVSSSRMDPLRQYLTRQCNYLSVIPCDDRPGKLFDGLERCRSCIFIARKRRQTSLTLHFTTRYNRWAAETRDTLFQNLQFISVTDPDIFCGQFPKLAPFHAPAFKKLFSSDEYLLKRLLSPHATDHFVFYQEATQYWAKATVGLPYYAKNGKATAPAHGRYLYFSDADAPYSISALLNSSLFYSFFISYGDCFHLNHTLAISVPVPRSIIGEDGFLNIGRKLATDLKAKAAKMAIDTKDGARISYDKFNVAESKPIIDEIDAILARHYGFTEEELDFIINYDIKYRMGQRALSEAG